MLLLEPIGPIAERELVRPVSTGIATYFTATLPRSVSRILFTDLRISWCAQLTNIILTPEGAAE